MDNTILQNALELKNSGFTYQQVINKLNLNIAPNTLLYHLKKLDYLPRKIILTCENKWCNTKFEIYDYYYNEKIHKKCKACRDYEKSCPICNKMHNKQALTCSKKCAYELKKISWMKSCGATHNFSKDSLSRKIWEHNLMQNSGVTNVFQLENVKNKIKDTYIKKYGVDHNMKSVELLVNRRYNLEKKGLIIPLNELTKFQIYKYNVLSFTFYNLRIFGNKYLGANWKDKIGINDDHIDHIYSIKEGFLNKIPAYIIGSIINLRLLYSKKNISKSSKSEITINELLEKYNDFENNSEHKFLIEEMKQKKSTYYELYFKLKNIYEN